MNKLTPKELQQLVENAKASALVFVYADRCVTGGLWALRPDDDGGGGEAYWIEWSLNVAEGPESRRQVHCLALDAWDVTRDGETFRFQRKGDRDKGNVDAPTEALWVFIACHSG